MRQGKKQRKRSMVYMRSLAAWQVSYDVFPHACDSKLPFSILLEPQHFLLYS